MKTGLESAGPAGAATGMRTDAGAGLRTLQGPSSIDGVRETLWALRAIGIVGLLGVGLIHLLNLPGTMHETPYIGWLTIGVVVGSLVAAAMLVHRPARIAWSAAIVVTASTAIAFVVSRTVGLPLATDDIGNWSESLGLASLFVEGVGVCAAAWAIRLLPLLHTESSRFTDVVHELSPPRGLRSRSAGLARRRVVYRHSSASARGPGEGRHRARPQGTRVPA